MPKKSGSSSKNKANKKVENTIKSAGLFDHIRQIQIVKDPHYFEKLTEEERKSFNVFLILRGLSMNPEFTEYAAYLYRFLDIIPKAQFYQILVELYPRHGYKEYHKWIKSSKDKDDADVRKATKLVDILGKRFEVSSYQAKEYLRVMLSSKDGSQALKEVVMSYGIDDEEATKLLG